MTSSSSSSSSSSAALPPPDADGPAAAATTPPSSFFCLFQYASSTSNSSAALTASPFLTPSSSSVHPSAMTLDRTRTASLIRLGFHHNTLPFLSCPGMGILVKRLGFATNISTASDKDVVSAKCHALYSPAMSVELSRGQGSRSFAFSINVDA